MTKRKVDNTLYLHLQGQISKALDLEYAIRASELVSPDGMCTLMLIDGEIREYWLKRDLSNEEIDAEQLMDYAWDALQVGFALVKRPGYRLNPEIRDIAAQGLNEMQSHVNVDWQELGVPATQFFRVCDLLSGNDIRRLLKEAARCLNKSTKLEKDADIEFHDLVRSVRQPIQLHPGVHYSYDPNWVSGDNIGLYLDMAADFSHAELRRQVEQFLFHYAVDREASLPQSGYDSLSRDLIQSFLTEDLSGEYSENQVERLDAFAGVLSGLDCWDRRNRHGLLLKDAINGALEDYPKEIYKIGEGAMLKNYRKADEKISELQSKFLKLQQKSCQ